jgi:hypothetical protein
MNNFYHFVLIFIFSINCFSNPPIKSESLELKVTPECDVTEVGPKKIKIKISYALVQDDPVGNCHGLSNEEKNIVDGAILYSDQSESRTQFSRSQLGGNLISCFDEKLSKKKEFSGFIGAHFNEVSKVDQFSDRSNIGESFSLTRGDRLRIGVLSLAAFKVKIHAQLTHSLTTDIESRFQILNNCKETFYRNDLRGRLLLQSDENVVLFLKQREIDGATLSGAEIQRNSVTSAGVIITPQKMRLSGAHGQFSFSGMRENIKNRTALLGELNLGAKSLGGFKVGTLLRGGLSEGKSGDYSVYGALSGRLSLPIFDSISLGLDGRVQAGRTPMQFRDGMLSDNEPYPFNRPFWFTGISLQLEPK